MSAQKFGNLASVFHMPLHAQRHGLNSLQKQKAVEWRQRCAGVPLAYGPTTRHKSGVAELIDIHHAVIRDLRNIQHVKLLRVLPPRKLARIDDHSADASARP